MASADIGDIDDIRVFKRALSVSEIDGFRSGSGRAPYQVSDAPTGTTAERVEQSDPGVLAGATGAAAGAGTATTFPASTTSGSTQEVLEEAARESAPPRPAYGSEEEAIAAQEQREQDAAAQEDAANQQASDEEGAQSTSGGTPRPTGAQAWSALSGHLGADVHTIEMTEGFVNEILWFEELDKPCGILIRSPSDDAITHGSDDCLFKIRTRETDSGTKTSRGLSSNREELQLDADMAIGGIEVCTNSTNKRLKGIRIYGDRINSDGSTTYVPSGTVMRKKPNCLGNWHDRVLCPTEPQVTLATGLLIHTKESGAITGLQLVCRAIRME